MDEERLNVEYDFGYKVTDEEGNVKLEIKPTKIVVNDMSPKSTSAQLLSVLNGFTAPAKTQVEAK